MNISSTPFIYNGSMRNDYWPDYNEVNQLNQRINDVESELALVNNNLSSDIENVSANLNAYANDQANTLTTNNIVVNNINANYALGKYANFANTNTDNAYIENLTVNKPVFDITLNTPHLENTTSLDGNFYNPNLINAKFSGDTSGDFNVINVSTANISNLFVNTQPTPVSSSAVLGYDVDGRVIPIHATFDAGFPENANYLFTDPAGTAFAGVAATEVGTTNNLITAYAVKNAIDKVYANVNSSFNNVFNSLNSINEWQNTFENDISNNFNEVYNAFNIVANNFNDVNNTFNNVNAFVNDGFNNVSNGFNSVNENLNRINSNLNRVKNYVFDGIYLPSYGVFSSSSPVDYRNVTRVGLYGDAESGTIIPGGAGLIEFNSSTNEVTFGYSAACRMQVYAESMFRDCSNLNQNITIPYTIRFAMNMFSNCSKLNKNIIIPNLVEDATSMFSGCQNLNQNILIPNLVTSTSGMFYQCGNLNQNILIPNSVKGASVMFGECINLNQNILIPNSVKDAGSMFEGCTKLNQNILIPNSVTSAAFMFDNCVNLNQDIYIYFQNVEIQETFGVNYTSMDSMFLNTKVNLHNVHIPSSVPKDTSNNLYNCLVNGRTGVTFAPKNIINDLPVDPVVWPPVI